MRLRDLSCSPFGRRPAWLLAALVLLCGVLRGGACVGADRLADGFASPPPQARPWTYWMWRNGQITREGITADLEALKRIGVQGVLIMNLGARESMVPRVVFMTPEWRELVRHAMAEAARLGMQVDMNNDDGWNCGGPWITPEHAMQTLTWSETPVKGPAQFSGTLSPPSAKHGYYRDVAVLAVPATDTLPEATRSVGAGPPPWIERAYPRPVTVRGINVQALVRTPPSPRPAKCILQVSDDGKDFRSVRMFETGWLSGMASHPAVTIGLDWPVSGRCFRLVLLDVPGRAAPAVDFTLEPEARVSLWELKAGFQSIREHGGASPLYALAGDYPKAAPGSFIPRERVLDLTDKMRAGGRLEWEAPEGNWTILRIGHTPTGHPNGAATAEGRGLDCDKLSKPALDAHLAGMLDKLLADAGPLVGKSLTWTHDDSWESGPLNWTGQFREEFKRRRGYDPVAWLPVMAGGRVVGSLQQSERFLWDVRRTIADLLVDNHLAYFRELSHRRGLKFSSESSGRQQFLYDPVSFQAASDMPMGEFWASEARPRPDCKVAASAAHLTGLPVAGAEAFTCGGSQGGRWAESPFTYKTLGDSAFCFGINHFVFHRTLLQPKPDHKPGMSWPGIGINMDSTQTWWEMAEAWIDYLGRCQYLLQQGHFVGDVAVLTGEGAPNSFIRQLEPVDPTPPWDASTFTEGMLRRCGELPPLPPVGYDYDGCDPAAVMRMTVHDGRLDLPSGMSYHLLLPQEPRMTPVLARKVRELVAAGATVVGPKPTGSPSLADFPRCDDEVRKIADEVWGDCDGARATAHAFGKGRVIWGKPSGEVLAEMGLKPDFEYAAAPGGAPPTLDFIHRRDGETEIYFISNQQKKAVEARCTFRIAQRHPELWYPDTGRRVDCTAFTQHDGRTEVPLHFDPAGSLFVVFRKPIDAHARGSSTSNAPELADVLKVERPWTVEFDPKWGGPASIQFDRLVSWAERPEEGVQHYSGTAIYRTTFDLPPSAIRGPQSPIFVDLGEVQVMARLRLNGQDLGVAWKPPFRVEITGAVRPGRNQLEVRVANLWVNRLIGDAGLPAEKRFTSTVWYPFAEKTPLVSSGLLGPVTVKAETRAR